MLLHTIACNKQKTDADIKDLKLHGSKESDYCTYL